MDDSYPMFETAEHTAVPMCSIEIPVEGRLRVRFYGQTNAEMRSIMRRLEEDYREWELVQEAMELERVRN